MQRSLGTAACFVLLSACHAVSAQGVVIPAGTVARAELVKSSSVHNEQRVSARLMDPVCLGDKVVLAAGSALTGEIVGLTPDNNRRRRARLNGDFTPFHRSSVRFDSLTLPSGQTVPIATSQETGAVVVRIMLGQKPQHAGSVLRHAWYVVKDDVRRTKEVFTAPGKGERFERFAYSQLPYHPEKLYQGVAYTFEFAGPVQLPARSLPVAVQMRSVPKAAQTDLRAYLKTSISSRESKPGTAIEAVVAEPYSDASRELRIPQGATLLGTVTQAKPAKWFGRSGKLRFAFRQVRFPEGQSQMVEGTPAAIVAGKSQELTMDAEGGVNPAPKDRFIRPLVLAVLANYASEGDGGNSLGGDAVASNGFGLLGRIVGIAAGSPELAMALGYYAVATSSYDSFIARGRDVTFPRNTRLEIQLNPTPDRPGRRLDPGKEHDGLNR
jgi:hypothetical protein